MAEDRVHMVDISGKADTEREAVAKGWVKMRPATLAALRAGKLPKGDVLATAQVAGIMGAKRVPDLIPLCHPLLLTDVSVEFHLDDEGGDKVEIVAQARSTGKTGVEMEALTAV
ncbi:MAG: cyclic pyranopterin monophosphate synthase MoaC, partial [Chloroflexi bacterium]|nr:cyclic pyranopterin monophosphate synthase MoaC [Chloroflexota bacterium]